MTRLLSCMVLLASLSCSSSKSGSHVDGTTGGGGACSGDGDCGPMAPYCDSSSHTCVQCITTTNCGNGRMCNTTNNTCVQCLMDGDCGAPTPYCSPMGQCVQCTTMANCGAMQTCNTNDYRCVATCGSNADCRAPTAVCDTTMMYCVQCLASTDCTGNAGLAPICDTANDTCVQCLMNSDCTTTERPKCNTTDHFCAQCLIDADCPMGMTCSPEGTCR